MHTDIGDALVAARRDLGIELDEVEERLKIRRRYLLALEAERWEDLPDPAYAGSFLRTYAKFLGLDGEALVERYRARSVADQPGPEPTALEGAGRLPRLGSSPAPCPPWGWTAGALAVAAIAVVLVLGGGGSDSPPPTSTTAQPSAQANGGATTTPTAVQRPTRAEVELTATGTVWTCLVDQDGKPLLDGVILTSGEKQGAFRAKSLEMTFGNGQVELRANGKPVTIDSPADPVGYRVTPGGVTELPALKRPTCG